MTIQKILVATSIIAGLAPAAQADNGTAGIAAETKTLASSSGRTDGAALLKRGRIVFLRCRSCHTLKEGERHLTGPNLHGLMGAKAAAKEGYAYSEPLSKAGVTWTEENLDAWLTSPGGFVKGNRMVFAGLPKASDRQALILYLAKETQ